jgi:tight adherence protein C
MTDFAVWITTPANLFGIIAFLLVFATVVTVSGPMMGGDQLAKRLKRVTRSREELRQRSREAMDKGAGSLRGKDTRSPFRKVVESLNLAKLLEDPNLKKKMIQAGMRGQGPIFAFYFFRMFAPIALGGLSGLYLFVINDMDMAAIQRLAICIGLTLAGYYAPGMYLTNTAHKRRDSIMTCVSSATASR